MGHEHEPLSRDFFRSQPEPHNGPFSQHTPDVAEAAANAFFQVAATIDAALGEPPTDGPFTTDPAQFTRNFDAAFARQVAERARFRPAPAPLDREQRGERLARLRVIEGLPLLPWQMKYAAKWAREAEEAYGQPHDRQHGTHLSAEREVLYYERRRQHEASSAARPRDREADLERQIVDLQDQLRRLRRR